MANLVIILGSTGTGKSTSIKTLNPKETVVFNTLGKRLPFKGSKGLYSQENQNQFSKLNYPSLIKGLQAINSNEKFTHIKNVIIDDCIYMMRNEFFEKSQDKGFNKFNEIAANFQSIISLCQSLRDDLNIFMMLHSENVENDGAIVGYKVSTVGKLLDKMYNPLESVTITLFAKPRYDGEGNPEYGFYTNKIKEDGIEIEAKTPENMFEDIFIPNDLQYVVDKMNEYYE